jgi:glutamate dehydrogenase (NAD(P)+)
VAIREVLKVASKDVAGTTFAIQGFGNVGSWLSRLLIEQGAKVVAVSDMQGAIFSAEGLDISAVSAHHAKTGSVVDFQGAEAISNADLLTLDCEVLVPAALGGVIHQGNARDIRAKYVLEAANGPTTAEADDVLHSRGVLCIPDIWANAGGVTVSYFEWTQNTQHLKWTEDEVNVALDRKMVTAHDALREIMAEYKCSMRTAAFVLGVKRVKQATDLRGLG